jgi:hypothetical protein
MVESGLQTQGGKIKRVDVSGSVRDDAEEPADASGWPRHTVAR